VDQASQAAGDPVRDHRKPRQLLDRPERRHDICVDLSDVGDPRTGIAPSTASLPPLSIVSSPANPCSESCPAVPRRTSRPALSLQARDRFARSRRCEWPDHRSIAWRPAILRCGRPSPVRGPGRSPRGRRDRRPSADGIETVAVKVPTLAPLAPKLQASGSPTSLGQAAVILDRSTGRCAPVGCAS
jgi:hypothetical protein